MDLNYTKNLNQNSYPYEERPPNAKPFIAIDSIGSTEGMMQYTEETGDSVYSGPMNIDLNTNHFQ